MIINWLLQNWIALVSLAVSLTLAGIKIREYVSGRPRFKITHEVRTVTDTTTPYTYFDLKVINKGRQTAKGCVLTLTVEGAGPRLEKVPIFWGNPRRSFTNLTQTVDIMGDSDDFKTAIFEMRQNQSATIINNYAGRTINVDIGNSYTFAFTVNCDPPAKKTVRYEVDVKGWDSIKVTKVRLFSR